jgi:transposase InsO family protein
VSRSAHYERASGRRSARAIGDEQLLATIGRLHEANFCAYGYRKMHLALRRAGIEDVGRDRVKRLMRQAGIRGPSAAASPGAPPRPIPTPPVGPIWSSASSPLRARTGSTSPPSPTCAAGKACCSSRS